MVLAYYDPTTASTANAASAQTDGAPATAPVMTGTPRDMIVSSDFGRRIYGFVGGVQAWVRDYPSKYPGGIHVFEGLAYLANGNSQIDVVNPKTGFLHYQLTVPNLPSPTCAINGVHLSVGAGALSGITMVAIAFDFSGAGSTKLYKLTLVSGLPMLTLLLSNPQAASYPRDCMAAGGWLVTADTFGHQVHCVDIASGGAFRCSTNVYYPNTVDTDDNANTFIICAEHENRVFRWTYPYGARPDSRTMMYSAPVAPYNDITKTKADIVSGEAATTDSTSTFTPHKSKVAIEYSGASTLYSPNSARKYGSDLLIADCDNYRVIIVNGGTITTTVSGFNNARQAVLI